VTIKGTLINKVVVIVAPPTFGTKYKVINAMAFNQINMAHSNRKFIGS